MATPDSPAVAPKTSNINVRRGEPLVVIDHVDKHFGDLHVLRDINTVVNRGEVVVVIGPSGSGKSTLCRTINRLEPIDSGTIEVDGKTLPAEGGGDHAHAGVMGSRHRRREIDSDRDGQVEKRAGRRTHDLGVVWIDRPARQDDRIRPRGVSRPDDRAEIAGIAHLLADRDEAGGCREDVADRGRGLSRDSDDALGCDGVGHGVENALGREDDLDARVAGGLAQIGVALEGGRRREHLDDRVGPVRERFSRGLRPLEQEQPGLLTGTALGQLRDRTNAGRTRVLEHVFSIGRAPPVHGYAKGRPPEGGRPEPDAGTTRSSVR